MELLLHDLHDDSRRRRRRLVAIPKDDDDVYQTCVVDVDVDHRPTNYTPEQWKPRTRGMIATTPGQKKKMTMTTMTTCQQLVMYCSCCCYYSYYWKKNLCESSFSGLFSATWNNSYRHRRWRQRRLLPSKLKDLMVCLLLSCCYQELRDMLLLEWNETACRVTINKNFESSQSHFIAMQRCERACSCTEFVLRLARRKTIECRYFCPQTEVLTTMSQTGKKKKTLRLFVLTNASACKKATRIETDDGYYCRVISGGHRRATTGTVRIVHVIMIALESLCLSIILCTVAAFFRLIHVCM